MKLRIKKETLKDALWAAGLLGFLLVSIIGVSFTSVYVAGATNITNNSVMTRVNVTNTEPNITLIFVDDFDSTNPSNDIDLIANGVKVISCNASIFDYNGWQDINATAINATFYINPAGTADNNHRYVNNSCGSCKQGGSSTNASCDCRFALQYYTNDSSSWVCNMTVFDLGGTAVEGSRLYLSDTEVSSAVTVTKLLAINTSSNSIIDYGNLSVTQTSGEIEYNVTNGGNINLNLSLRGYGGSDNGHNYPPAQNVTMICDFGNISDGYQRYSVGNSGTAFSDMKNITNSTKLTNLTLFAKTDDNAIDGERNSTYWRLQVPLGVGGLCNGTVIFGARNAET